MSEFIAFKDKVQQQLNDLSKSTLFKVAVDPDVLWNTYLDSFPEGTNLIHKERREYDCNCCRQFIRDIGAVVCFEGSEMLSVWDVDVDGKFAPVAEALSRLVKSHAVKDVYFHHSDKVGTAVTPQHLESGEVINWEHLSFKLPSKFVLPEDDIASKLNDLRTNKEMLERSVRELTTEALETVIELIDQDSLYRGKEHRKSVAQFMEIKAELDTVPEDILSNTLWVRSLALGGLCRFRNTVIGTLVVDLSEGRDLEAAVASFQKKVAPENYHHTTALYTSQMKKSALNEIIRLGLESSLYRRFAVAEDLTINNVLYADRSAQAKMTPLAELMDSLPGKTSKPNLSHVEEVHINKFIQDILPHAESIEMLLENHQLPNLFSLVAPVHADANPLFKWDNGFSWAYASGTTDSNELPCLSRCAVRHGFTRP